MNMRTIALLLFLFGVSLGANILVLLPIPLASHLLTFKSLFIELAQRGHNVTYFGSLNLPETKNLRQIVIHNSSAHDVLDKLVGALRQTSPWGFLSHLWEYGPQLMDIALDHPALKDLLQDETSKYDLIITEPYFLHEPLVVFGWKFKAPIVGIFPLGPTIWASYLSGNPAPLSFVPSYKMRFSDRMSLMERVENTLIQLYELLGSKYYYLPRQEELMKTKMTFKGSENLPPLEDMLKDVSLHLLDYHFSTGYNRPFENNILQVGGLSMARSKSEPLDETLFNLMDKSKGVIYFSLGNHVQLSSLGKNTVEEVMRAFARLGDYQVFMKWNDEQPPAGLPSNVKISSWFPQPSVLSHPKCKVMIGHGGLHGIMEAVHNGVPIIGIPQFSDQEYNTNFVVTSGFGLRVGMEELSSDSLFNAITALLDNPRYKENAVIRSKIERDRVMQPLDLAVFGIEYVLRHKGAVHLRPTVLDISWYQYILLDVLLIVVIIPLVVIILLCKFLKSALCGGKTRKPKYTKIS